MRGKGSKYGECGSFLFSPYAHSRQASTRAGSKHHRVAFQLALRCVCACVRVRVPHCPLCSLALYHMLSRAPHPFAHVHCSPDTYLQCRPKAISDDNTASLSSVPSAPPISNSEADTRRSLSAASAASGRGITQPVSRRVKR